MKAQLLVLMVSIGLTLSTIVAAQTVTVDLNTEYQSISGFGGVNMPGWINDLNPDQVDKAFGNNPGQIGLSILRIRVPNDSNQFYREVPTALQAREHGAIILASPWSPPAYMKSNNNLVGGFLLPEYYDAYAGHLKQFATFMIDSGAPLYAVSLQNEPDIEVSYESCDWSAQQFIDFLEQEGPGFDTLRVVAPESFQFRRPLSDSILNDTEAEPHVDIIGGHIYGGGLFDYPLARDKGKEVWMTEHLTGSSSPEANDWELALTLGNEINECMKANFNAYIWWYIRRFYSLINDDGNITQKGYVMSHFSKFIRPSAVRVDAAITSAPGIDATAYKTDTSLVIVVINDNETGTDISFTIENGAIDTLTKFTTSPVKNVVNEGGYSVTGGTFSASVDAKSITTFTSYAENGGSFENIPPLADAGDDISRSDEDGDGTEPVTLDGSNSTDPDGNISNFSWSVNGTQFSNDTIIELLLDIGDHVVVLTVTDNDGATDSDTLNIAISSIYSTELWYESECAQVGSVWEILTNDEASHGEYIAAPAGVELVEGPSTDTADQLVIDFEIDEPGPYKVWARVITPSANDDSYWVQVDTSAWAMWNNIPGSSDWHWDDVHDGGADNNLVYNLDAGEHTLRICYREDGALLDKILIANTGLVPEGIGEADTTCPEEPVPDITQNPYDNTNDVLLFPNPAGERIHVSWQNGFRSLMIAGLDGKAMIRSEYSEPRTYVDQALNLEPGIYILILRNKEVSAWKKLIIE